ncbi:unnamed protein product, partial [Musa hybrid cultivar]
MAPLETEITVRLPGAVVHPSSRRPEPTPFSEKLNEVKASIGEPVDFVLHGEIARRMSGVLVGAAKGKGEHGGNFCIYGRILIAEIFTGEESRECHVSLGDVVAHPIRLLEPRWNSCRACLNGFAYIKKNMLQTGIKCRSQTNGVEMEKMRGEAELFLDSTMSTLSCSCGIWIQPINQSQMKDIVVASK